MLQEIGFVCRNPEGSDELSLERFDEVSIALSTALDDITSFDINIGSTNSFEDAAFIEVHDGGGCEAVHRRLREVAAVPMIPRYAFLPHITIAHYLGQADAYAAVKSLQTFRDIPFGAVHVTEVEIATLRVDIDYPPIYTSRKLLLKS